MRYYSGSDIDLLIEEIREAAYETIELAAGEAAKAALLESVEREAAALREASGWRMEAPRSRVDLRSKYRCSRSERRIYPYPARSIPQSGHGGRR